MCLTNVIDCLIVHEISHEEHDLIILFLTEGVGDHISSGIYFFIKNFLM